MRSASRIVWVVLAVGILVGGTLSAFFGARAVALDDVQDARQSFVSTSIEISSTLELAISHEEDLAVAAGAFYANNEHVTESQFVRWTASERAFDRYPELLGVAVVKFVPASQLSTFADRVEADPAGPLSPGGRLEVIPPGSRAFYCLSIVSQTRTPALAQAAGLDYCDGGIAKSLMQARDEGGTVYIPDSSTSIAVGNAIFKSASVPPTVALRRADLLGWTGVLVRPSVLLAYALSGHPAGTAVALSYISGSSQTDFEVGHLKTGDQSYTIPLAGGWYVKTFANPFPYGVFRNRDAVFLLVGGLALSLVLCVLIFVLGTSRSRALVLVAERTGQLQHQAFHDGLTGLPNRRFILEHIEKMRNGDHENVSVAALILNLDNFKDINDSLGYDVGDELLVAIAERLTGSLYMVGEVGRLSGDEFVVVVETDGDSSSEMVAEHLLLELERPFYLASHRLSLSLTGTVGIAESRDVEGESLLRDADTALYRAKTSSGHRLAIFDPSMQAALEGRRILRQDLRTAVDAGQFFLLYQPTFTLDSGALKGVEALLRWRHPTQGVVPPDLFVPPLESSGFILDVGRWVLEHACAQAATWQASGNPVSMSVNLSVRQLEQDRIVDDVHGALASSGLQPASLTLELTETALMRDVDSTVRRLKLLKAIGVRLAIDDFGTGYSSLAYLAQFPFDIVKIDKSFVTDMANTAKSLVIIRAFVELGKALGLEVVAEGIETASQLQMLVAQGVDVGQGYLLGRPLGSEAVGLLLRRSTAEEVRVS